MTRTPWANSTRRQQLPTNWPTIRQRILHRDNHTCQTCGAPGRDIDHIKPGNDHRPHNLVTLCPPCHTRKTSAEGVQARRKQAAKLKRPTEPHPGTKPADHEG